jgi:ParB family chromosome partitioning protein
MLLSSCHFLLLFVQFLSLQLVQKSPGTPTSGIEKGELRKICPNPECPIHHPKRETSKADATFKAENDKRRREEALANATGIRILNAIVAAVPVRLMKRDLLFIVDSLLPLLDERRLAMLASNRGIKAKDGESISKLLTASLRKAEESVLGRAIVEAVILLSARSQSDSGKTLRAAAQIYKVDADAVALKVKQEFAAKEKAKSASNNGKKIGPKSEKKALKKTA